MEGLTRMEQTEIPLVSIKHPENVRTEPPRHTNQSQSNTNLTEVSVWLDIEWKKNGCFQSPPGLYV